MEPTKDLSQPSRLRGQTATLGSTFGFRAKAGSNISSGASKPQDGIERLNPKDSSQSGVTGMAPTMTKSRFGFKPKVTSNDNTEMQSEKKNGNRGDNGGANSSFSKESAGVKAPMNGNNLGSYSKSKYAITKEDSEQASVQDKPSNSRSKFASLASRFQSKTHSFSNPSKKIQNGDKISPTPGQSSTLPAEVSGKLSKPLLSKLSRPAPNKPDQKSLVRAPTAPSRASSCSLGSKDNNGADKSAKSSNHVEPSRTFVSSKSFGQIQVPKSLQPQAPKPSSSQLQAPKPSSSQLQAPVSSSTQLRGPKSSSSLLQQPSKMSYSQPRLVRPSSVEKSSQLQQPRPSVSQPQASKPPASNETAMRPPSSNRSCWTLSSSQQPSPRTAVSSPPKSDSLNEENPAFEPLQECKASSKPLLASEGEAAKEDTTNQGHNKNNASEALEELSEDATRLSLAEQLIQEDTTEVKETNNNKRNSKLKKSLSKSVMMTVTNGKPRRTKPIEMYLSRLGSVVKSVRKSSSSSSVISDVSSPIDQRQIATTADDFTDEKDKDQDIPDKPDPISRPPSQPKCPSPDSDSPNFHVHFTNSYTDKSPHHSTAFVHFDNRPVSSKSEEVSNNLPVMDDDEMLENEVMVDRAVFNQMNNDVDKIKVELFRLKQVLLGDVAADSGIDSQSEESLENAIYGNTHQSTWRDSAERANQENKQLKKEVLLLRQQLEEKEVVIQNLKESLKVSVLTLH